MLRLCTQRNATQRLIRCSALSLSTHRVSEAEGRQIAGGEHATGAERRQRSDVVRRLLLGRRRRRRGVLPAAEEGLQLQLRWALLHPSLGGRHRAQPLSRSFSFSLSLRLYSRPVAAAAAASASTIHTRLLETGGRRSEAEHREGDEKKRKAFFW